MKKTIRITAMLLVSAMFLVPAVQAKVLSPGLAVLAEKECMVKTGTLQSGISFSAEDFQNAFALYASDRITITSLPNAADGILYLGNVPIAVNQSISVENLNRIRFQPTASCTDSGFVFKTDGQYALRCMLRITDTVNFSPIIAESANALPVWTHKDIPCYGTLQAYDPENDELVFEIVDYPEKGLLVLKNTSHGDFQYTPYVGCSGKDSFTYKVRDSYGNYSEVCEKQLYIDRQDTTLTFADLENHWAHSAAIEMVSEGIMSAQKENDALYFSPDSTVTREEFLVMVMKALGVELSANPACVTVFADDSQITDDYKVYIHAAYQAGIIHGRSTEGNVYFAPTEPITRAETAVILNHILGSEVPVNAVSFSDHETVPAWAQNALYALHALGIMSGTGSGSISPSMQITRAQAAQILLNLRQYTGQAV